MKKTFLLLVFISVNFFAQSFTWEPEKTVLFDTLGHEFVYVINITNTSQSDLTLAFVRTENDLPEGWYSSFCLGVCFPDFVDSVATTDAFMSSPLTPGETRELSVHFFTGTNHGSAHFKMKAMSLSGDNTEYEMDLYGSTEVAQGNNAFTIAPDQTTANGDPGAELIYTFDIVNTSPIPLELEFIREKNEIPAGWSSSLCIENCYPPFLDTICMNSHFGLQPIQPGAHLELSMHVFTDGTPGEGSLKLKAVNPALPGDEYSFDLTAKTAAANIDFDLTTTMDALTDTLNSEIVFTMKLKNNTEEEVAFDVLRTQNDLPADWTSSLCFDACFAPHVDSVSTTLTFQSEPLAAQEEREISIHIFPATNTGTGNVKVKVKPVGQPDNAIELSFSATASLTSVRNTGIASDYSLNQNYPNPFNPSTKINFSLKEAGFTKVEVFNILGKKVDVLVNDYLESGSYNVNFNASELSSGVYIYRITSGKFTDIKKMILEK